MKTIITITWKAFQHRHTDSKQGVTSASVAVDYDTAVVSNEQVCDIVFAQTNCYAGSLWEKLEPVLPANRTHTALSVGDEVTISKEGVAITYRCDNFGWQVINAGLVVDETSTEQLSAIGSAINAPLDARSN